ncbi:TetR/AcrR family transcriptional regulator [Micromonospora sp. NPDC047670]|uniref:TetR/AcrR family transcriptional regulator n=1 Tax=Micromonospora sp. NPDC047670 TaxID=3364252 RepID=UPI003712ACFB
MAPRRQQEIFNTTLTLLAEKGYEGLTIEGVAGRAGVNKTTIYRWWPSKAALLAEALVEASMLDQPTPDTGSLRGDLEALTDNIVALLTAPPAADVAVAALAAAAHRPELAASAQRFFVDRFAREQPIFERAVARGELAKEADPMTIMDMIAGAVWLRAVFRRQRVDREFVHRVVATALHGTTGPRSEVSG